MIAAQELLQANILTEVYRAEPTRSNEMCAEVFISNQDSGQWTTLDVALSRGAQDTPAPRQYLYRGYSQKPNETVRVKLSLRSGDSIRVRVTTARVSIVVAAEELVTPHALEGIEDRIDQLTEDVRQLIEQGEAEAAI